MSAKKCQKCGRTNSSSVDVLRLQGWRFWTGPSVTGAALDVSLCATCTGLDVAPEVHDDGFDAECDTCGEAMSDDDDGEDVATREDAEAWKRHHLCEPDVSIIEPTKRPAAVPEIVTRAVVSTRSL